MRLSLKTNISWSMVAQVLYCLAQLVMLVSLTKLTSPKQVGIFAIAFAISSPIIMFTNLRLRWVKSSDASGENTFYEYVILRLFTTLIGLSMITVIAWLTLQQEAIVVTIFIGIAKSFEAMSDIYYGYFQKNERMDLVAVSMISRAVVSILGFVSVLYFTRNLVYACATLAVSWGLAFLLLDFQMPRWLANDDNVTLKQLHWKAMFRSQKSVLYLALSTLPLGIVGFFHSLDAALPRYFIDWFLGKTALGYFAPLYYVLSAGCTVMTVIVQSAMFRISKHFIDNDMPALKKLLAQLLSMAVFVGIGAIIVSSVLGEWLLGILFGASFSEYNNIFVLLMVCGLFNYIFLVFLHTVTAMRYYRVQLWLFVADIIIASILYCLFIPAFGLAGVVWVYITMMASLSLFLGALLYRDLQVRSAAVLVAEN